MYFDEPEGTFVVASKAGAHSHPAWFHNLSANPEVSIEKATANGIEQFTATAEPVTGALRDDLYARFAQRNSAFENYQAKTDRNIPVVAISRH